MTFITKNVNVLQTYMDTFLRDNATEKDITFASECIAACLYGAKTNLSLSNCRFQNFCKLSKNAKFSLAQLPPTRDAIKQHGLRTYFQVQQWKGHLLDPLIWGWKKSKYGLIAIRTTAPPAPEILLKTIACGCTTGCHGNCGCRKSQMNCSIFCKECMGMNCDNAEEADIAEEDINKDMDDDIDLQLENVIVEI